MNFLDKASRFLGSLPFALFLIATTALFVIAGTFLESLSASHRFAAQFTYGSPLFSALLCGFFVNILVSALRRWPFQRRHIPFLTTHLGLLMVIGGALLKNAYGLQGAMEIVEGSGNQEILLPDTQAILLEAKGESARLLPIRLTWSGAWHLHTPTQADGLHIELVGYAPHAAETRESWIKGKQAMVKGLPPIPEGGSIKARLSPHDAMPWTVSAVQSSNPDKSARTAYLQGLKVRVADTATQEVLFEDLLEKGLDQAGGSGIFTLNWERGNPSLLLTSQHNKIRIPLNGPESLLNANVTTPYLGKAPLQIDLERAPALLFIQDQREDVSLWLFDPFGRVHAEVFLHDGLHTLIAYDKGFGGYAVQALLPYAPQGRAVIESARRQLLASQLREGIHQPEELSPPLALLLAACRETQSDFVSCCLDFLDSWDRSHSWLFPAGKRADAALAHLDWSALPARELQACLWIEALARALEPPLREGRDLMELLRARKWPLLDGLSPKAGPCTPEETDRLLKALTGQIVASAERLPPLSADKVEPARLFSACLRAYGLHLSALPFPEASQEMITLETPLTVRYTPLPPLKKLEENRPIVKLKWRQGEKAGYIALRFDPFANGLKWPILDGAYTLRFQPETHPLPYRVRLRQARQISYAGSAQPYSYESDLIFRPLAGGESVEKTISMNNVHESREGYRFYLANIAPADDESLKHIQLVVNYDPAKYWLTYPGGIILALGISLFCIGLAGRRKLKQIF